MGPVKQYTSQKVDGPLTVWVHPGADGSFSWYEDDGVSFNLRKGEFMRVNLAWNNSQRGVSMRLANGSKMMEPRSRDVVVRVAGENVTRNVAFTGNPVEVRL